MLAWTLCHHGRVVHTGHRHVVVFASLTLLLGRPGGLHQVVVHARRRWWVVQGVMGNMVGMVVVKGRTVVVVMVGSSTLLIRVIGGQTPVTIS